MSSADFELFKKDVEQLGFSNFSSQTRVAVNAIK
jgi:hypothetical protein